jgi:hypothetical protein
MVKEKNNRPLRILFAPSNIASFASITMDALNRKQNIEAKGFSLYSNKYWSFGKNWFVLNLQLVHNPLLRKLRFLYGNFILLKKIYWADVIHWQWSIGGETYFDLHYKLIKQLKKPILIEWLGSDIRIPEIVSSFNPFYKEWVDSGKYFYKEESNKRSLSIQEKFSFLNAYPAVCPEMSLFVEKKFFKRIILLYQRIHIESFTPVFPEVIKKVPKVVHTPSAPGAKGTESVRAAVEKLKLKGLIFEYIEIHNKSKSEALEAISKADIFLDQFIIGGYGMATCEAMAFGKPVFCYLMSSVQNLLPTDCPIINVNISELQEKLEEFIIDPSLRRSFGERSREYVEKYHDANKIADQLVAEYKNMLTIST